MQTGHFAAARAGWTRSRHLTAQDILRAWRIYWGSMAKAAAAAALMGAEVQRIDKSLWFASLAKNRSVAQDMAETGYRRVNGRRPERAHASVRGGDLITFHHGRHVRSDVSRVGAVGGGTR